MPTVTRVAAEKATSKAVEATRVAPDDAPLASVVATHLRCHFMPFPGICFLVDRRGGGLRGFAIAHDPARAGPKAPTSRWSRGGALQRVGELIKACAPQPRARRGRFASSPDQATMRTATLALLPAAALGHGALQLPPSWHNPGGVFSAFLNDPHQPGAGDQNAQGCTGKHAPGQLEAAQGCAAEWYTNYTFANPSQPGSSKGEGTGEPTIARSSPLRTYQDWNFVDNKACTFSKIVLCGSHHLSSALR